MTPGHETAVDCRLDGTALAARLAPRIRRAAHAYHAATGQRPALVAFLDLDNPVAYRQAQLKAAAGRSVGVDVQLAGLAPGQGTDEAVRSVGALNGFARVHGVFVQYPLPARVSADAVVAAMAPAKDLDASGPPAYAAFLRGGPAPAAAAAMRALLRHHGVPLAGRDALVVGRGTPHDAPLATVLERAGARVRTVPPEDTGLDEALQETDLVVAAVGSPGAVPGHALRPGAVVVDAGYFNAGGVGDVDLRQAPRLGALAPVPGGLGPMTVSVLLRRTVRAAWRSRGDAA